LTLIIKTKAKLVFDFKTKANQRPIGFWLYVVFTGLSVKICVISGYCFKALQNLRSSDLICVQLRLRL